MKILLSILAILALVFLIGCSARDTGNISKKELESLASKYGGVYIFDKKFYEEIVNRERERELVSKQISDEVSSIKDVYEQSRELRKKLKERYYNNPKIAQTLSNGKRYYTDWTDPKFKYDKSYEERVEKVIGKENLKKYEPAILLGYFYVDDNNKIVAISFGVGYSYQTTKFGLYGDEGRGIKFTNTTERYIDSDNIFYMQDLEK